MKRILLMAAVMVTAISAYSQSYRGFVQLNAGIPTGGGKSFVADGNKVEDYKPIVTFGFTTVHGCQLTPSLFVGLGTGVYAMPMKGNLIGDPEDEKTEASAAGAYIPIFANARWDLDIRRKVTPFVSVSCGYQIAVNSKGCEVLGENGYKALFWESPKGGFHFEPQIGVRFMTGKRKGVNIGISYLTALRNSFYTAIDPNPGSDDVSKGKHVCDVNNGALMFNLAFDF